MTDSFLWPQPFGYLSCGIVCCCHGGWGFVAALVSAVGWNYYPCSSAAQSAEERTAKLYTRSLCDPANSIAAKNGGEHTLLNRCGDYSQSCSACWERSCCHSEENDNGMVTMCFQIFSFGAAFALPLSLLLGLPGLLITSIHSSQRRPKTFDLFDGDEDFQP